MSETNGLTSDQAKAIRNRASRNFKRFWPIYVFMCCTAGLSFASGLMLPFMRSDVVVPLTWGTAFVALYYALGFLTNGELVTGFWFGKITDQDPDNTAQKIIAWVMLGVSVIIVAATCLSAADMIAFWMGAFDAFYQIPLWVQKYVVYVIPVMWVVNTVAAILFRSVSDEAIMERVEESRKNKAMSEARIIESKAYADELIANAPALARQKGSMKAKAEIELMQAEIDEQRKSLGRPAASYAQDVRQVEFSGNGNGNHSDPQSRQS